MSTITQRKPLMGLALATLLLAPLTQAADPAPEAPPKTPAQGGHMMNQEQMQQMMKDGGMGHDTMKDSMGHDGMKHDQMMNHDSMKPHNPMPGSGAAPKAPNETPEKTDPKDGQ
ncbi:hypothetical protein M2318_000385 [Metapseudomonas resinovorans]|uniref:hypothetical protein n=1 Tax=Metapseudomonas resinovorans TaxID=53412 RepID=UPI003D1BD4DB